MFWRGEEGSSGIRGVFAWIGLALMAVCVLWLQLLPRSIRTAASDPGTQLGTGYIRTVIIDPGHGGNDSGAMRDGILEKDLTLDVARRVERRVRATGLATILTRSGDDSVSLASRAEIGNREDACVFVSIHFDEGARAAATGVQTYYATRQITKRSFVPSWLPFLQKASHAPENLESQSLAGFVQEALVARTHAFDRGTRAEQFYVVANVRHPAVLVEGGFLSNNEDVTKLVTEDYREQLALAISEGVVRYREIANQARPIASAGEPGT